MRQNRAVDTASFRESPEQSKYNHHTDMRSTKSLQPTEFPPMNSFIKYPYMVPSLFGNLRSMQIRSKSRLGIGRNRSTDRASMWLATSVNEAVTRACDFAELEVRMEAVMVTNPEVTDNSSVSSLTDAVSDATAGGKQHVEYGRKHRSRGKQLAEARRRRWAEDADVNRDESPRVDSSATVAETASTTTIDSGCTAEKNMKMLDLGKNGKTGWLWWPL